MTRHVVDTSRALVALVALVSSSPTSSHAVDCFAYGLEALRRDDFEAAAAAFARAAADPACQDRACGLRLNEGFALLKLAEGGDAGTACHAVAAFERVIRECDDRGLIDAARTQLAEVSTICLPPVAPYEIDGHLLWGAGTVGAGALSGILYGLATNAYRAQSAARAEFIEADGINDEPAMARATRRFGKARLRTDTLATLAYVGFGATGVLASLWAWSLVAEDDGAGVGLAPGSVGIYGVW